MKRLLCTLLAITMLLTCTMTALADDVIEVDCWYQNAQYEPWLSKMADDFNAANPGIKVNYEMIGDDNALTAALMAAFQEGSAPTLFHTRSNASFATYAAEGVLEDLSGCCFGTSRPIRCHWRSNINRATPAVPSSTITSLQA